MTKQYFTEDINTSPSSSFCSSRTLAATQQGTTDTAVFNFVSITTQTADVFGVVTTAAAGTVITILKPGVYIATLTQSINAANLAIGISLGATAAPFTTTPVAIGTVDGLIALRTRVANDAGVLGITTSFSIAAAAIDGTANVVRFMGNVGGTFITGTAGFQLSRVTAS